MGPQQAGRDPAPDGRRRFAKLPGRERPRRVTGSPSRSIGTTMAGAVAVARMPLTMTGLSQQRYKVRHGTVGRCPPAIRWRCGRVLRNVWISHGQRFALPTTYPHSRASRPQLHRFYSNYFYRIDCCNLAWHIWYRGYKGEEDLPPV